MAERALPLRRPFPIGRRGAVLWAIFAAGLAGAVALELGPAGLVPRRAGWELARDFVLAALRPALDYQAERVPPGAPPLLVNVLLATGRTLVFAAAAMSVALPAGALLGLIASDSWWRPEAFGGGRLARVARPLQVAVRVLIALMRSVHELLWAVILLAAVGLNTAAAVVALAIPFTGTLAKVFSEMLDEAPRDSAQALFASGAGPLTVLVFGQLPRAAADMAAYAFYRLECAVRSSAVLGFFGYPTLGYQIVLSFSDLHYREVWTYLYALLALVALFEAWSGALRRRMVG